MATASGDADKPQVSFERFTDLLNEELRTHPQYRAGLRVEYTGSGYDLVDGTGTLTSTQISAICNAIHGVVSRHYVVCARD